MILGISPQQSADEGYVKYLGTQFNSQVTSPQGFTVQIRLVQSKGGAADAYYGDVEGMYDGSYILFNDNSQPPNSESLAWLSARTDIPSWSLQ